MQKKNIYLLFSKFSLFEVASVFVYLFIYIYTFFLYNAFSTLRKFSIILEQACNPLNKHRVLLPFILPPSPSPYILRIRFRIIKHQLVNYIHTEGERRGRGQRVTDPFPAKGFVVRFSHATCCHRAQHTYVHPSTNCSFLLVRRM